MQSLRNNQNESANQAQEINAQSLGLKVTDGGQTRPGYGRNMGDRAPYFAISLRISDI